MTIMYTMTYLVFLEEVCAIICSLQVVLSGTPIHNPSSGVVPVNRGLSVQNRPAGEQVTKATKLKRNATQRLGSVAS